MPVGRAVGGRGERFVPGAKVEKINVFSNFLIHMLPGKQLDCGIIDGAEYCWRISNTAMTWVDYLRSANWNQASGIGFCAYLLGCFAAGYYLVRSRLGEDIRELGSGSVGARNVGRLLGKSGFLITLLCDFGKGGLAVWAARHFTTDERIIAMAMVMVVVGHIWPAQLRFHGGKGMATSLGALLVYDPKLALIYCLLFLGAFVLQWRTVLPALFALLCLPLVDMFLGHDRIQVVLLTVMSGLVLFAHRRNIAEEISHLIERRHMQTESDKSL
jgi:acyl phosphate:glycerol-3-phosphate acyltransferase